MSRSPSMLSVFLCMLLALEMLSVRLLADTNPAFDETAVAWQDDRPRYLAGVRKAEQFRLKLLAPHREFTESQPEDQIKLPSAAHIGRLLEHVRTRNAAPLPNRPTLKNFQVTADRFVKQLRGEEKIDPQTAYQDFSGRWYGEWNQLLVDHHWHPAKKGSRFATEDDLVQVTGHQYAWIGDGFGWNYLVQPEGRAGQIVLGYVYHIAANQPETIRFEFPLVGYCDGPGRLIWITPSAIFFEEAYTDSEFKDERYAITGFLYQLEDDRIVATQGHGFQAIYTRKPTTRPPWLKFDLELNVESTRPVVH